MTTSAGPKQMLIEHIYPGDIAADITDLRGKGWSWRSVADHVSELCNLTVSHESIRSWYDKQDEAVAS